jgi:hypothetical protein
MYSALLDLFMRLDLTHKYNLSLSAIVRITYSNTVL